MQNNMLRHQAILSRDSENHGLSRTGELGSMALGAYSSGIGSERDPKLTADHISTSIVVW